MVVSNLLKFQIIRITRTLIELSVEVEEGPMR